MIEESPFDQYILTDGKILSLTCNYETSSIEIQLQVRKYAEKKIFPCIIFLSFEDVFQLDLLDSFDSLGNYSDIVLVKLSGNQIYASFDPFGNSGIRNESDNFVIKASKCLLKEK